MMKRLFFKLLILLALTGGLSSIASAQLATVQGTLTDTTTTATGTNTFVRFRLRNFSGSQPKIGSTSALAKTQVDMFPNSSGVLSGSIEENAGITPAGTYYTVEIWNNGVMTSSANYIISTNPWNLNTATPIVTPPIPSGNVAFARTFVFLQTSAATSWPINHNFGAQNVVVQCADSNSKVLIPDTIVETDANNVTVTFTSPQTGSCIIMNAGNVTLTGQPANAVVLNPTGDQNIVGFNFLHNGSLIPTVASNNAWTGNETHAGTETFNGTLAINGPFLPKFTGPSPWIDVTSSTYGAACDGVTNDTTAIQNAINAAALVPATVYFPPGKTCLVTSLTMDGLNGITIRGGWGAALPSGNTQATISFTNNCSASACLSMRSTGGINFYDIALAFPNATNGPMVDLSHSALNTDSQLLGFHGVTFSGSSTSVGPIVLDQNTDSVTFDAWTQFYTASVFVTGPLTNSSGSGFSDQTIFNQVIMEIWGTSAIQNASISWTFNNITAESMFAGSCLPFLQYVNSYTNIQNLSITNSLFSPGANSCANSYTLISVPAVSGNLGGITLTNDLLIPNTGATAGTMLSAGNGESITAFQNVIQSFPTVFSIGTGVSANIGPSTYTNITTFLSGTPASGSVLDNTGVTTTYGGFRVGAGSKLNSIFYGTSLTLNSAFTSITAGTCQEQTLTLTGITVNGVSSVNPTAALGTGFNWQSWVSGANTITVRVCAGSTGTPNSVSWNASVID